MGNNLVKKFVLVILILGENLFQQLKFWEGVYFRNYNFLKGQQNGVQFP